MKKNSILNIALIILIAITLLGGLSFALINYMVSKTVTNVNGSVESEKKAEPSAKELEELAVPVKEIVTNLASENIVQMSFTLQADNKKAAEELNERMFQVNDLIISLLHKTTKEQLEGEGLEQFKETIIENVNNILHEGKVDKVFITSAMMQ